MVGGEVVYIADEIDFGNGVEAKFPNNDTVSESLNSRSVGGLQGRDLSREGKRTVKFYNHVAFVGILISTDYESNRSQGGSIM